MTGKPTPRSPRATLIVTMILAVLILVPSMAGFVAKFIELIHVVQGDGDGLFALTPIVNYLCASLGFLFLLLWATMQGMFTDVERPKHSMLELQERLDRNDD